MRILKSKDDRGIYGAHYIVEIRRGARALLNYGTVILHVVDRNKDITVNTPEDGVFSLQFTSRISIVGIVQPLDSKYSTNPADNGEPLHYPAPAEHFKTLDIDQQGKLLVMNSEFCQKDCETTVIIDPNSKKRVLFSKSYLSEFVESHFLKTLDVEFPESGRLLCSLMMDQVYVGLDVPRPVLSHTKPRKSHGNMWFLDELGLVSGNPTMSIMVDSFHLELSGDHGSRLKRLRLVYQNGEQYIIDVRAERVNGFVVKSKVDEGGGQQVPHLVLTMNTQHVKHLFSVLQRTISFNRAELPDWARTLWDSTISAVGNVSDMANSQVIWPEPTFSIGEQGIGAHFTIDSMTPLTNVI